MSNWLIILGALALLAVIICGLSWWYLPSADLPGPETLNMGQVQDGESSSNEDWADQLHVIKFAARLEGPIAELTHYEVEYVAHTLMRVPEWVPERLRAAA